MPIQKMPIQKTDKIRSKKLTKQCKGSKGKVSFFLDQFDKQRVPIPQNWIWKGEGGGLGIPSVFFTGMSHPSLSAEEVPPPFPLTIRACRPDPPSLPCPELSSQSILSRLKPVESLGQQRKGLRRDLLAKPECTHP